MKHFRSLLLLLCPTLALPGVGNAAELSLTPSLCAIDEGEDTCSISINVAFTTDESDRYCLQISGRGVVQCFAGHQLTKMKIHVTADADTEFQVTEADSGAQVATATLKVARYRPTRHQRRYGWGLL
ncbi:DUF3019 domain-containing protein [Microbulbifer guangxiensis]|uniref:DUF3019 domain-containing protein n=1 Tax=Microbulbifer guangxiensis TaxID=2904249 RepID=UPI001F2AD943|nr:DUF3019 domain-containing protein [Microbulbifer guangxiensis]